MRKIFWVLLACLLVSCENAYVYDSKSTIMSIHEPLNDDYKYKYIIWSSGANCTLYSNDTFYVGDIINIASLSK
jgi:hypothetical protein